MSAKTWKYIHPINPSFTLMRCECCGHEQEFLTEDINNYPHSRVPCTSCLELSYIPHVFERR